MASKELYKFSCEGIHGKGRVVLQIDDNSADKSDTYAVVSYARVTGYNIKPSTGHPFHTNDLKKAKAEYNARVNMIQNLVGGPNQSEK